MKISIIAFSERGTHLAEKIASSFDHAKDNTNVTRGIGGILNEWTNKHFQESDALIFVGSTGIAIRAIAPYVKSKLSDPAVLVVDELGIHVIPILSGHVGGANELALFLAEKIAAQPVITTATDINHLFAVDSWATKNGFYIENPKVIKRVSAALLAGKQVQLLSDFKVNPTLPQGIFMAESQDSEPSLERSHPESCIHITYQCTPPSSSCLNLIPPVVTAGIGCRRGVDEESITEAYGMALKEANIHPKAVQQVFSIDLKADEEGLLSFCKNNQLSFKTFTAQELMSIDGDFTASEFVKSETGTDNVCERAAMLGNILASDSFQNEGQMPLNKETKKIDYDKETFKILYKKFSHKKVTISFVLREIEVKL